MDSNKDDDLFEDGDEILLKDLDIDTMRKLIVSCITQTLTDDAGKPADIMSTVNELFISIADKRFTITIRDNSNLN